MQNVASTLCRYPAAPKFCQNRSISHRFRDECAFALYAEIQDGCQKWQESDFCKEVTSGTKNFVEIALSRTVSEISVFNVHAEIQDGRQKWRESDFCKKSPVHSRHPEG